MIRIALELGRPTGIITFDRLNELLPSATTEPEDIDAIMQALSDEGINLVEREQSKPQ
ncbi:RNA polymerase sigma factor region1.1 domain-containing protein [Bradyrhizobium roseum]|uniref:RNA polymerase sigma factor region1.1 domain-containing protein n=1 Tax=Bradyrhizobium roseum TaxID=3056648 RepID=UPI002630B993|nr:RNA polymerase sigma factor region1.1 domain-containing protein [Bradyrhizobium roseus]WKA28236.1 RNA polymerase sigma factor region1.1 domain-containing protein [Bradyrhizobium roseus]